MVVEERKTDIVIIDDEWCIREVLDMLLEETYKMRLCESAEAALAIPKDEAAGVRVLFLDGYLGRGCMTGDEALPELIEHFPRARIVYIGALGEYKAEGLLECGVHVMLPKPWDVEDIKAAAAEGMAWSA